MFCGVSNGSYEQWTTRARYIGPEMPKRQHSLKLTPPVWTAPDPLDQVPTSWASCALAPSASAIAAKAAASIVYETKTVLSGRMAKGEGESADAAARD